MDKDELLRRLGKNISEVRKELGISQQQLGSSIGKNQQSIQRLEAGRINPSYIYLLEIANGLKIPISKLIPADFSVKSINI